MPPPTDNERTALYRLYDADGRLLYVGISKRPVVRWAEHAVDKGDLWWSEVERKTVEWFDTREEAESAEVRAIREEKPEYNKAHSPVDLDQLISEAAAKAAIFKRGHSDYGALADLIRATIDTGEWLPGQRIPPLREIQRQFMVSGGTLQRALLVLRETGVIVDTGGGYYVPVAPQDRPALLYVADLDATAEALRSRLSPEDRVQLARLLLQSGPAPEPSAGRQPVPKRGGRS